MRWYHVAMRGGANAPVREARQTRLLRAYDPRGLLLEVPRMPGDVSSKLCRALAKGVPGRAECFTLKTSLVSVEVRQKRKLLPCQKG